MTMLMFADNKQQVMPHVSRGWNGLAGTLPAHAPLPQLANSQGTLAGLALVAEQIVQDIMDDAECYQAALPDGCSISLPSICTSTAQVACCPKRLAKANSTDHIKRLALQRSINVDGQAWPCMVQLLHQAAHDLLHRGKAPPGGARATCAETT